MDLDSFDTSGNCTYGLQIGAALDVVKQMYNVEIPSYGIPKKAYQKQPFQLDHYYPLVSYKFAKPPDTISLSFIPLLIEFSPIELIRTCRAEDVVRLRNEVHQSGFSIKTQQEVEAAAKLFTNHGKTQLMLKNKKNETFGNFILEGGCGRRWFVDEQKNVFHLFGVMDLVVSRVQITKKDLMPSDFYLRKLVKCASIIQYAALPVCPIEEVCTVNYFFFHFFFIPHCFFIPYCFLIPYCFFIPHCFFFFSCSFSLECCWFKCPLSS